MKDIVLLIAVVTYAVKVSAYCSSEDHYYSPYKCCTGDNPTVYYEDSEGSWGVENKEWCVIEGNTFHCEDNYIDEKYNTYSCCNNTYDIITSTYDVKKRKTINWGYEKGQWCATPKNKPYVQLGNPFGGHEFYINQDYVEMVDKAISKMNNKTLIAQAEKMKNYSNAIWIDSVDDVENKLEKHLKIAKQLSYDLLMKNNEQTILNVFVLNNLPGRNCHSYLKNDDNDYDDGEFGINDQDLNNYKKKYIDAIETKLKKYYKQPVVLIIEPNSLTNLVINSDRSRCKKADQYYREGHAYLIKKLGVLPNVSLYLDIGNAYWFKTDKSRNELAKVLKNVIESGSTGKVRGFASNVGKYAPWFDRNDTENNKVDEYKYLKAMHDILKNAGIKSVYFVEDSSRNGRRTSTDSIYLSCNQKNAGVGFRPQANPVSSMDYIDAFYWIKPHGFSEEKKSENYLGSDFTRCKFNAPNYGEWFQEHFEEGLIYSNPSL